MHKQVLLASQCELESEPKDGTVAKEQLWKPVPCRKDGPVDWSRQRPYLNTKSLLEHHGYTLQGRPCALLVTNILIKSGPLPETLESCRPRILALFINGNVDESLEEVVRGHSQLYNLASPMFTSRKRPGRVFWECINLVYMPHWRVLTL